MATNIQHRLEAWGFRGWLAFCRLLPLDTASNFGAFLGRLIGPCLSANRTAHRNLERAMPELSPRERNAIVKGMWAQLGRVGAELAFLPGTKLTARAQYEGLEYLPKPGQPVIFISGHIGNWELLYSIAYDHGTPITLVYREANNQAVDAIINATRKSHATDMFPKGPKGAVRLVRAIKGKQSLAMLVDQKMNEGISVPFFGMPAMTAPAVAELSLRYNLPIIPARVIRTGNKAQFRAMLYPPLEYTPTGDQARDVEAIMVKINAMFESWIREYPEQWFWVHKRWPKE